MTADVIDACRLDVVHIKSVQFLEFHDLVARLSYVSICLQVFIIVPKTA